MFPITVALKFYMRLHDHEYTVPCRFVFANPEDIEILCYIYIYIWGDNH